VEPREPVPLNGKGHHNDELTKMERKILTALAQAGKALTNPQIGVRIGGSARGGAFNSTMTELRKAGYINSAGGESDITIDGRQALGPFTPLPTGPELFEYWVAKVGTMGGKILNALRTAHVRRDGRPQTKESIGIDACVSSGGGAFNGALTKLRKLELIVDVSGGILLSEDLRRAAEPTVEVYDRSSRTSQRVSARTGLPVQS
ncbi:MAG TPA: hypothetical protein VHO25_22130, partial [Polyangiaceae bacterium]|nr:hypothetical protein [Polyangiaceae bacterium]